MKHSLHCPVCRSERELTKFDGKTAFVFTVICFAVLGILVHWVWFIVGIGVLTVGESLFRMYNRAILACPKCDYDPYLYARDIPKARSKVEAKLQSYKDQKIKDFDESITQENKATNQTQNSDFKTTTKVSKSFNESTTPRL